LSALGLMPQLRLLGNALSAIAMLIALVLAWRVLSDGMNALQGGGLAAFWVRPPASAATATPEESEAAWRAQLAQYPVDYKALVMLGRELERQGRIADARAAMDEALRLAPADQRTLLEVSAFYLRAGDVSKALWVMERVAHFYPGVRESLWPVFAGALDGGRHDDFFAAAARANPDWWPQFFSYACQKSANVDALQRLFATRAAEGIVDADERRCMIGRLQQENEWANSYQAWINSLPPEQRQRVGYVFNGNFEWPLSDVGFDWRIPAQEGVDVRVLPIDGASGPRALKVEFVNKLWEGPPVQQHLMLYPGRYRFEGLGRADRLQTWLGVQWGLYCLPLNGSGGQQLTRSNAFMGSSGWERLGVDFTVPGDCPVQVLRLELANPRHAAAMDDRVTVRLRGSIWFEDLRVRRLD
jgi:hypothetical protein